NLSEKAEIEDINSLLERNGMKLLHSFRNGAVLVETRSIAGLESIGAMIAAHPSVRSVETNQIIRINAVPNDEKFGELYGMHNEGQTGGTADVDIDAPEAWEISTGSRDVVVG